MTTMLRIRYFFTRLRTLLWVCPECGNRLGSTKQCQSCDEQQAALQGMASDDLRLLRSILRSLASLWSSIVIYVPVGAAESSSRPWSFCVLLPR
jgi:hypothetical protein